MKRVPALDLGERPVVKSFADWGRRNEQLIRDPTMQLLARGVWAQSSEPLSPLQRAALLQQHLRTRDNHLRVTGLNALELLDLPIGETQSWVNPLLGHRAGERESEFETAKLTPHLSWHGTRVRTFAGQLRMTKSRGLSRYYGPWGCFVAHPVEALVVAAPYLSVWRLIACVDALLSRRIVVDEKVTLRDFTADVIEDALESFPPTSPSVRRVRAALRAAYDQVWSPNETLTRLIALRHGFPPPRTNYHVTPQGRHFYIDLAWPDSMTAIEYNGEVHYKKRSHYEDENYRIQLIRDSGWDVQVLVWRDLWEPERRRTWLNFLARNLGPPTRKF